jgi:hypothetical protein
MIRSIGRLIGGYFRTRDRNKTVTIRAHKQGRDRRTPFETLRRKRYGLPGIPPGLQPGYFLARVGRDCQILEAGLDLKNAIAL